MAMFTCSPQSIFSNEPPTTLLIGSTSTPPSPAVDRPHSLALFCSSLFLELDSLSLWEGTLVRASWASWWERKQDQGRG